MMGGDGGAEEFGEWVVTAHWVFVHSRWRWLPFLASVEDLRLEGLFISLTLTLLLHTNTCT